MHVVKRSISKVTFLVGALLASAGTGVAASAADSGRGPMQGFFVSDFPDGGFEFLDGDLARAAEFTEIQVLSLPPGKYIANASAVLASNDVQLHLVDCTFTIGGVNQGALIRGMIGGDINNFATLPLTIGFTLQGAQDLGVACRSDAPRIVVSQPSPLTAIRIGRLTVQNPE
jgi:hypothetical protein